MLNESPIRIPLKSGPLLALLSVLYIVATVSYSLLLGDTIRYPDEAEYLSLARSLANTGQYTLPDAQPTAFRPPAYPLFLATGMKLGLSVTALRILSASTLLACMALVYILLRKASLEQARIAVLLVMAYPVLFYTASTFHPQIPAAALFLAALTLLFIRPSPGLGRCFTAGTLLGLAILMVPTFAFILLFTALYIAFHPVNQKMIIKAVLILGGAGIILLPWMARNTLVFGRPVPISTNFGINLLLGNNAKATPNSGATADISHYEKAASGLTEVDANVFYTQAAVSFIKKHPVESLTLYAGKTLNYFNYQNPLFMKSEQSPSRTWIMLLSYGLLLGLALLRVILTRGHPLTFFEKYIAWLYLLNAPVSALFFTRIRFRLPMDILLIVLASSSLVIIIAYLRKHRKHSSPVMGNIPPADC